LTYFFIRDPIMMSRRLALSLRTPLLLVGALAVARLVAAAPEGVLFRGLTIDPPQGQVQSFRLEFDRTATLRVHDELIDRHDFYLDFYGVENPGGDREWSPGGNGVFHVKQIYYAPQRVLRFVFYCRGDAWFAVQTHGLSIHEVQVRPVVYTDLGRVDQTAGGPHKRVVIDPGHGGVPGKGDYHLGARTARKIGGRYVYEKEVTLEVARRLDALIKKTPNLEGVLTRDDDRFLSLEDRIDLARKAHGDLFVSIHMNGVSGHNRAARGFEVYYLSGGGKETNRELVALENDGVELNGRLSDQKTLRELIRELADEAMSLRQSESRRLCEIIDQDFKTRDPFRQHDRGVKSAPFRVLMNFEMPAALVECGFLDHPTEGALLIQPDVQQRIAALLFNGINRYFAMEDPDFRPTRVEPSP
jgi:N-acetylmuramoyl-L-alanine amidase